MAKKKLHFPMRGKNTNFAASTNPQFTSPLMLNVRPRDVLENRARGGQRPGFKKAYNQQIGGGDPVVAIGQVSVVEIS